MAGLKERDLHCTVVNESVRIKLKSRRSGGFSGPSVPFVQCDQQECQYVDENVPPCPLHPDMFADEIAENERRKREDY
jgi:hypothetical protein